MFGNLLFGMIHRQERSQAGGLTATLIAELVALVVTSLVFSMAPEVRGTFRMENRK